MKIFEKNPNFIPLLKFVPLIALRLSIRDSSRLGSGNPLSALSWKERFSSAADEELSHKSIGLYLMRIRCGCVLVRRGSKIEQKNGNVIAVRVTLVFHCL